MHFNTDAEGEDIVVLRGVAKRTRNGIPEERLKAYLRKYQGGIGRLNMTRGEFLSTFSESIIVTPIAMRGY